MADGFKIQVSRVITVAGGRARIRTKRNSGGLDIGIASLNHAGLKVPKCRRYRVTYIPSPRGAVRIIGNQAPFWNPKVASGRDSRRFACVCFLSMYSKGTRFRRVVEVLER